MQKFDVLIIGGGMVGLTLALSIRKLTTLTVAIVEPQPLSEVTAEPSLRVSAINMASQHIFNNLDAWLPMLSLRAQPYQNMHVWDKAGYGHLDFSLSDLPSTVESSHLGHIIENNVIRQALWQKAEEDQGITFFTGEKVNHISHGEQEAFVSFEQQAPVIAKLVVGADGANSWVRQHMNIPTTFKDYDHHAIVATISGDIGHQNTAWQVFLPEGPLAFLPLFEGNKCSIVWSTSPEHAKKLLSLSSAEFAKELTQASDGKLGNIQCESERASYPLRMRCAQSFVKERVVLVGDAAHTIHPLAGQGVNLGLLDATALAQSIALQVEQSQHNHDSANWVKSSELQQFSRWRKNEASEMIVMMSAIKQVFSPQQLLPKFIRGLGLSGINQLTPLKSLLVKQAVGDKSTLPKLATKFFV